MSKRKFGAASLRVLFANRADDVRWAFTKVMTSVLVGEEDA